MKRYGALTAVDNVDISVEPGEVVGLLGPNGAGKSSIFRMLVGSERADAGRISLDGDDLTEWPMFRRIRQGVSYLPQGKAPADFGNYRFRDNLSLASGRPLDELDELLREFGLHSAGTNRGSSVGRFTSTARSVALSPNVTRFLLLDEPFAGVEPLQIDFLKCQIRNLRGQGVGMLVTDHAVRDVLPICDRALDSDHGVVQCGGSPEVVAAEPTVRVRYLGEHFQL